eukprot:3348602-Lingulodinium_polyedra.AAC.1
MDVRLLWSQQAVLHLGLRIRKIDGAKNRADLGTKSHAASGHVRLRALCNLFSQEETPAQPALQ